MALLTEVDRKRIRDAVEAAEDATAGEFVTVIARRADTYPFIPLIVAALVTLLVSGLALIVWPTLSAGQLYVGQVILFVLLALVFRWPPLTILLIPKAIRQARASRLARELFMRLELSATEERTGVMLFVSAAEHYVEIIADRGVHQHVSNEDWQHIVDGFIKRVRAGAVADGFVEAIDACVALMAHHLPPRPGQQNRLPDHLIEI